MHNYVKYEHETCVMFELLVSLVFKMKSNLGKKVDFSCTQASTTPFHTAVDIFKPAPVGYSSTVLPSPSIHPDTTTKQGNQLASSKPSIPPCVYYNNISCFCFHASYR